MIVFIRSKGWRRRICLVGAKCWLTDNYDTTILYMKNPSKKIASLATHQVLVDHSGDT